MVTALAPVEEACRQRQVAGRKRSPPARPGPSGSRLRGLRGRRSDPTVPRSAPTPAGRALICGSSSPRVATTSRSRVRLANSATARTLKAQAGSQWVQVRRRRLIVGPPTVPVPRRPPPKAAASESSVAGCYHGCLPNPLGGGAGEHPTPWAALAAWTWCTAAGTSPQALPMTGRGSERQGCCRGEHLQGDGEARIDPPNEDEQGSPREEGGASGVLGFAGGIFSRADGAPARGPSLAQASGRCEPAPARIH